MPRLNEEKPFYCYLLLHSTMAFLYACGQGHASLLLGLYSQMQSAALIGFGVGITTGNGEAAVSQRIAH